jgi:hypothetical protein
MAIRFLCPKGHRLSSPDDRVGRNGKCPHCGTMFQVPDPSQSARSAVAEGETLPQAVQILEFYCPNQHYLTAPLVLQGKRGRCPQCGATFQIPFLEEGESSRLGMMGAAYGDPALSVPPPPMPPPAPEPEPEALHLEEPARSEGTSSARSGPEIDFSFVDAAQAQEEPEHADPTSGEHPLAILFEQLWFGNDPEAVVELFLSEGERLVPQDYSHKLSRGQHGVFATQDRSGTHTITVVPWSEVRRVTVRGLTKLPKAIFE